MGETDVSQIFRFETYVGANDAGVALVCGTAWTTQGQSSIDTLHRGAVLSTSPALLSIAFLSVWHHYVCVSSSSPSAASVSTNSTPYLSDSLAASASTAGLIDTTFFLYIDGVLVATSGTTPITSNWPGTDIVHRLVGLGGSTTAAQRAAGGAAAINSASQIDNIGIYTRALSAGEVQVLYANDRDDDGTALDGTTLVAPSVASPVWSTETFAVQAIFPLPRDEAGTLWGLPPYNTSISYDECVSALLVHRHGITSTAQECELIGPVKISSFGGTVLGYIGTLNEALAQCSALGPSVCAGVTPEGMNYGLFDTSGPVVVSGGLLYGDGAWQAWTWACGHYRRLAQAECLKTMAAGVATCVVQQAIDYGQVEDMRFCTQGPQLNATSFDSGPCSCITNTDMNGIPYSELMGGPLLDIYTDASQAVAACMKSPYCMGVTGHVSTDSSPPIPSAYATVAYPTSFTSSDNVSSVDSAIQLQLGLHSSPDTDYLSPHSWLKACTFHSLRACGFYMRVRTPPLSSGAGTPQDIAGQYGGAAMGASTDYTELRPIVSFSPYANDSALNDVLSTATQRVHNLTNGQCVTMVLPPLYLAEYDVWALSGANSSTVVASGASVGTVSFTVQCEAEGPLARYIIYPSCPFQSPDTGFPTVPSSSTLTPNAGLYNGTAVDSALGAAQCLGCHPPRFSVVAPVTIACAGGSTSSSSCRSSASAMGGGGGTDVQCTDAAWLVVQSTGLSPGCGSECFTEGSPWLSVSYSYDTIDEAKRACLVTPGCKYLIPISAAGSFAVYITGDFAIDNTSPLTDGSNTHPDPTDPTYLAGTYLQLVCPYSAPSLNLRFDVAAICSRAFAPATTSRACTASEVAATCGLTATGCVALCSQPPLGTSAAFTCVPQVHSCQCAFFDSAAADAGAPPCGTGTRACTASEWPQLQCDAAGGPGCVSASWTGPLANQSIPGIPVAATAAMGGQYRFTGLAAAQRACEYTPGCAGVTTTDPANDATRSVYELRGTGITSTTPIASGEFDATTFSYSRWSIPVLSNNTPAGLSTSTSWTATEGDARSISVSSPNGLSGMPWLTTDAPGTNAYTPVFWLHSATVLSLALDPLSPSSFTFSFIGRGSTASGTPGMDFLRTGGMSGGQLAVYTAYPDFVDGASTAYSALHLSTNRPRLYPFSAYAQHALQAGAWQLIHVTYDGASNTFRVYASCASVTVAGSEDRGPALDAFARDGQVLFFSDADDFYVAELALYHRVLSASEIAADCMRVGALYPAITFSPPLATLQPTAAPTAAPARADTTTLARSPGATSYTLACTTPNAGTCRMSCSSAGCSPVASTCWRNESHPVACPVDLAQRVCGPWFGDSGSTVDTCLVNATRLSVTQWSYATDVNASTACSCPFASAQAARQWNQPVRNVSCGFLGPYASTQWAVSTPLSTAAASTFADASAWCANHTGGSACTGVMEDSLGVWSLGFGSDLMASHELNGARAWIYLCDAAAVTPHPSYTRYSADEARAQCACPNATLLVASNNASLPYPSSGLMSCPGMRVPCTDQQTQVLCASGHVGTGLVNVSALNVSVLFQPLYPLGTGGSGYLYTAGVQTQSRCVWEPYAAAASSSSGNGAQTAVTTRHSCPGTFSLRYCTLAEAQEYCGVAVDGSSVGCVMNCDPTGQDCYAWGRCTTTRAATYAEARTLCSLRTSTSAYMPLTQRIGLYAYTTTAFDVLTPLNGYPSDVIGAQVVSATVIESQTAAGVQLQALSCVWNCTDPQTFGDACAFTNSTSSACSLAASRRMCGRDDRVASCALTLDPSATAAAAAANGGGSAGSTGSFTGPNSLNAFTYTCTCATPPANLGGSSIIAYGPGVLDGTACNGDVRACDSTIGDVEQWAGDYGLSCNISCQGGRLLTAPGVPITLPTPTFYYSFDEADGWFVDSSGGGHSLRRWNKTSLISYDWIVDTATASSLRVLDPVGRDGYVMVVDGTHTWCTSVPPAASGNFSLSLWWYTTQANNTLPTDNRYVLSFDATPGNNVSSFNFYTPYPYAGPNPAVPMGLYASVSGTASAPAGAKCVGATCLGYQTTPTPWHHWVITYEDVRGIDAANYPTLYAFETSPACAAPGAGTGLPVSFVSRPGDPLNPNSTGPVYVPMRNTFYVCPLSTQSLVLTSNTANVSNVHTNGSLASCASALVTLDQNAFSGVAPLGLDATEATTWCAYLASEFGDSVVTCLLIAPFTQNTSSITGAFSACNVTLNATAAAAAILSNATSTALATAGVFSWSALAVGGDPVYITYVPADTCGVFGGTSALGDADANLTCRMALASLTHRVPKGGSFFALSSSPSGPPGGKIGGFDVTVAVSDYLLNISWVGCAEFGTGGIQTDAYHGRTLLSLPEEEEGRGDVALQLVTSPPTSAPTSWNEYTGLVFHFPFSDGSVPLSQVAPGSSVFLNATGLTLSIVHLAPIWGLNLGSASLSSTAYLRTSAAASGSYSISCYIYPTLSSPYGSNAFIYSWYNANTSTVMGLRITSGGGLTLSGGGSTSSSVTVCSFGCLAIGTWSHVVQQYDQPSGTLQVLVNGAVQLTWLLPVSAANATGPLAVASKLWPTFGSMGPSPAVFIAHLRLYNYSIGATGAAYLMSVDIQPPPPTSAPTPTPTTAPTSIPTVAPTSAPTRVPTAAPSAPTAAPTSAPTKRPTSAPSARPTTAAPTARPTAMPSAVPTTPAPTKARRVCALSWWKVTRVDDLWPGASTTTSSHVRVKLYRDGALLDTASDVQTSITRKPHSNVCVGSAYPQNNPPPLNAAGYLDNLAGYSTVLSDDQVRAIYHREAPGYAPFTNAATGLGGVSKVPVDGVPESCLIQSSVCLPNGFVDTSSYPPRPCGTNIQLVHVDAVLSSTGGGGGIGGVTSSSAGRLTSATAAAVGAEERALGRRTGIFQSFVDYTRSLNAPPSTDRITATRTTLFHKATQQWVTPTAYLAAVTTPGSAWSVEPEAYFVFNTSDSQAREQILAHCGAHATAMNIYVPLDPSLQPQWTYAQSLGVTCTCESGWYTELQYAGYSVADPAGTGPCAYLRKGQQCGDAEVASVPWEALRASCPDAAPFRCWRLCHSITDAYGNSIPVCDSLLPQPCLDVTIQDATCSSVQANALCPASYAPLNSSSAAAAFQTSSVWSCHANCMFHSNVGTTTDLSQMQTCDAYSVTSCQASNTLMQEQQWLPPADSPTSAPTPTTNVLLYTLHQCQANLVPGYASLAEVAEYFCGPGAVDCVARCYTSMATDSLQLSTPVCYEADTCSCFQQADMLTGIGLNASELTQFYITGPTSAPTAAPTAIPTAAPTRVPTAAPTTAAPTTPSTSVPTAAPTSTPTARPTSFTGSTGLLFHLPFSNASNPLAQGQDPSSDLDASGSSVKNLTFASVVTAGLTLATFNNSKWLNLSATHNTTTFTTTTPVSLNATSFTWAAQIYTAGNLTPVVVPFLGISVRSKIAGGTNIFAAACSATTLYLNVPIYDTAKTITTTTAALLSPLGAAAHHAVVVDLVALRATYYINAVQVAIVSFSILSGGAPYNISVNFGADPYQAASSQALSQPLYMRNFRLYATSLSQSNIAVLRDIENGVYVPSMVPTAVPTAAPTSVPTAAPSIPPTSAPTAWPTRAPTAAPSVSLSPTSAPTHFSPYYQLYQPNTTLYVVNQSRSCDSIVTDPRNAIQVTLTLTLTLTLVLTLTPTLPTTKTLVIAVLA